MWRGVTGRVCLQICLGLVQAIGKRMQKQSPRKTDRGKCSLRSNKRVYRHHAGTDRRIYISPRKLPWGHLRRGPRRQQRAHATAPCTTGPSSPLPGASPHPLRSNFPLVAFCHGPQPCYKTPLTSRGTRLRVCYPEGSGTQAASAAGRPQRVLCSYFIWAFTALPSLQHRIQGQANI